MFGQDSSSQQFGQDLTGFGTADPAAGATASATPAYVDPDTANQGFDPASIVTPTSQTDPVTTGTPTAAAAVEPGDDLLDIKQHALQELSPLVSHLDQTPEEKFRTTMMMIQASDDQSLVKDAYDAAKQITDEKTRAQALLDVVNEINYFTQHNNGQ